MKRVPKAREVALAHHHLTYSSPQLGKTAEQENGQTMDLSHHSPNFDVPDTMNGETSEDILNENIIAQLQSAADAAEAIPSILTNHAINDGQEQCETASASSARASPPRTPNIRDTDDSIVVSQQDAVRALRKYTTLANTEIFRRVGVSSSGGYRYLRGDDIREKETRGRKRKLDESIVNKIIHEIESQPVGEKTKSWDELCKLEGVEGVSAITLKRAVENAGYYKCSHCQRVTKAHGMSKELKDTKDSKDAKESQRTPG